MEDPSLHLTRTPGERRPRSFMASVRAQDRAHRFVLAESGDVRCRTQRDDGDGHREGERGRAGEDAPKMEAFDAWELRWIARELPTLDAAWLPVSSLDPAVKVVDEHDVYVLTRSDRINLKVRHRENALKLKSLLERTDDGFERWRTEFDVPLPAT